MFDKRMNIFVCRRMGSFVHTYIHHNFLLATDSIRVGTRVVVLKEKNIFFQQKKSKFPRTYAHTSVSAGAVPDPSDTKTKSPGTTLLPYNCKRCVTCFILKKRHWYLPLFSLLSPLSSLFLCFSLSSSLSLPATLHLFCTILFQT